MYHYQWPIKTENARIIFHYGMGGEKRDEIEDTGYPKSSGHLSTKLLTYNISRRKYFMEFAYWIL